MYPKRFIIAYPRNGNLATLHEYDEYAQRNNIKYKTIQINFWGKNLSGRHDNHIFAIFCVSFRMLEKFLRGILLIFFYFPASFPAFFSEQSKVETFDKKSFGQRNILDKKTFGQNKNRKVENSKVPVCHVVRSVITYSG